MLFFRTLHVRSVCSESSQPYSVSVPALIAGAVPNCTAFGCSYRRCTGCRGRTGTKVEFAAKTGHSAQQLHGISIIGWRWQLSARSLYNEPHHARQQSASKCIFQVWYIYAIIRSLHNQSRDNLCYSTYLNTSTQNFHSSYLSQRKSNLTSTSNLGFIARYLTKHMTSRDAGITVRKT